MSYRIQYFHDGKFIDTFMGSKSLPETHASAIAGLVLHGATSADILDMNNKDKVVAKVRR
ncbi:MAG TPA: hypothetical protein VHX92_08215 [Rhizomicrobium sp.]|jgi:hypothetical protein|nr:hypothetical protein [Rhizomicrobium sp.]